MSHVSRRLELGPDDISVLKAPISFDASVHVRVFKACYALCLCAARQMFCSLWRTPQELFIPWTYGGKVVLAVPGGEKDTQYLTHVMAEQGITHCFMVPSQLDALLQVRV